MMNQTDRAFVAAYQQSLLGIDTASDLSNESTGPHFATTSVEIAKPRPKAPLTAFRASRQNRSVESEAQIGTLTEATNPEPLSPGVELASFAWPTMVERVVAACENDLISLIQQWVAPLGAAEPVALCAASDGVGATTLTLSLARTATRAGLRTAIVDAVGGGEGLAAKLGIRRSESALLSSANSLDTALISSRIDNASLLSAADITTDIIGQALQRLKQTHHLVLVDAGIADAAFRWIGPAKAVLVDSAEGIHDYRRDTAIQLLGNALSGPLDMIETLAPPA